MTEKLKEERDKVMKEKEIYKEGYQDGKLFAKELENKKVKRLKEEIDLIPVVKKDNTPYQERETAIILSQMKVRVKRIINSIMGDFENHSCQDNKGNSRKNVVGSNVDEVKEFINKSKEDTTKNPDNTLSCSHELGSYCRLCGEYIEPKECQKSGDFEDSPVTKTNVVDRDLSRSPKEVNSVDKLDNTLGCGKEINKFQKCGDNIATKYKKNKGKMVIILCPSCQKSDVCEKEKK